MAGTPAVSIIIAVHNDENYVARALESAAQQSLRDIEIICVDDVSTDGTTGIVEGYLDDPRISLIRHETNGSAFQARRTGIEAARAPYVLFLDGDDELAPDAAATAIAHASDSGADVVGFGVEIVMPPGEGAPRFESTLQPRHKELRGIGIISELFPAGAPAQGHLWRYLFRIELLRTAYSEFDRHVAFYRANDIPITFLALAAATKYVSTKDKLYRYFFRRGTSGHEVSAVDDFMFYLKAIDSIESIQDAIMRRSGTVDGGEAIRHSYDSARRSLIGNLLHYCGKIPSLELQAYCLDHLVSRAGELDVVLAAADFQRDALGLLVGRRKRLDQPIASPATVDSVVLTTANLGTGGLQGVLVAQADQLIAAGIDVTVVVHKEGAVEHDLPAGASVARVEGQTWASKIEDFLNICAKADADAVVDHHLLYNDYWPFYALAAEAVGIRTIGWLHNFALRPMFDGTTRASFMLENLPILHKAVALSRTDVAFWKLNGIENVVYLPNPLSPVLLNIEPSLEPKVRAESRVNLVWWGRLQQATKQVRELIKVAGELRRSGIDFQLSIIGPDGPDLTRNQLMAAARASGVEDAVSLPGPLHGEALTSALAASDICLMTSAIEGYPLTLIEAHAFGLPVVMYELPWLAFAEGNAGVLTVPQDDYRAMAREIAILANNDEQYAIASSSAREAVRKLRELDFGDIYRRLLEDQLPEGSSPAARPEDVALLSRLSIRYSERTARAVRRAQSRASRLDEELRRARLDVGRPRDVVRLPSTAIFLQYRSKGKSRWRQFVTRLVPSTWRQANHLAEKSAKWNSSALTAIVAEQSRLADTVDRLERIVRDSGGPRRG